MVKTKLKEYEILNLLKDLLSKNKEIRIKNHFFDISKLIKYEYYKDSIRITINEKYIDIIRDYYLNTIDIHFGNYYRIKCNIREDCTPKGEKQKYQFHVNFEYDSCGKTESLNIYIDNLTEEELIQEEFTQKKLF